MGTESENNPDPDQAIELRYSNEFIDGIMQVESDLPPADAQEPSFFIRSAKAMDITDYSFRDKYMKDVFPISIMAVCLNTSVSPTFDKMAENYMPLGGSYFGSNAHRGAFDKYKIGMIYRLQPPMTHIKYTRTENEKIVLKNNIRSLVQAVSKTTAINRIVHMWAGADEYRWWHKNEHEFVQLMIQYTREAEREFNLPYRPYIVYEPNNRGMTPPAPGIRDFTYSGALGIDISVKGAYIGQVNKNPGFIRRSAQLMYQYTKNMRDVRKIFRTGGVALDMTQDYTGLINDEEAMAYIRRNCYIALIYGAQSILVYSHAYGGNAKLQQGYAYCSVAKDLNGPAKLAPIFLQGQQLASPAPIVVGGNDNSIDILNCVNHMFLSYNDKLYLIAVNITNKPLLVTFAPPSGKTIKSVKLHDYIVSAKSALQNGLIEVDFGPLEICVLDLS